jgi:hypothetical protein
MGIEKGRNASKISYMVGIKGEEGPRGLPIVSTCNHRHLGWSRNVLGRGSGHTSDMSSPSQGLNCTLTLISAALLTQLAPWTLPDGWRPLFAAVVK